MFFHKGSDMKTETLRKLVGRKRTFYSNRWCETFTGTIVSVQRYTVEIRTKKHGLANLSIAEIELKHRM